MADARTAVGPPGAPASWRGERRMPRRAATGLGRAGPSCPCRSSAWTRGRLDRPVEGGELRRPEVVGPWTSTPVLEGHAAEPQLLHPLSVASSPAPGAERRASARGETAQRLLAAGQAASRYLRSPARPPPQTMEEDLPMLRTTWTPRRQPAGARAGTPRSRPPYPSSPASPRSAAGFPRARNPEPSSSGVTRVSASHHQTLVTVPRAPGRRRGRRDTRVVGAAAARLGLGGDVGGVADRLRAR